VTGSADGTPTAPPGIERAFGDRVDLATRYVELLRAYGGQRGLIGPRELDRLWDRHVLNSVVVQELVPHGARVVDVGSGAGLPGVPLAIARPDLDIVLLEPMARRVAWLEEVSDELELPVQVVRGRAEERVVHDRCGRFDVVTGRALAPLARFSEWCLPLARPGGLVLAMKGASATDEVARDREAMRSYGARNIRVVTCGSGTLAEPATVVSMTRWKQGPQRGRGGRRTTTSSSRRRRK